MLVKMVLKSYKDGYRTHVKRMDMKRYLKLQDKIGLVEDGIELIRLEIIEE